MGAAMVAVAAPVRPKENWLPGTMWTAAEGQNGTMESAMKGDKSVRKTQDGWQTPEEIAANGGGGGGGGGRGGFGGGVQKPAADQVLDLIGQTKSLALADGAISGDLTDAGVTSLSNPIWRSRTSWRTVVVAAAAAAVAAAGGGRVSCAVRLLLKDGKGTVKIWTRDGALSQVFAMAHYRFASPTAMAATKRQLIPRPRSDSKDVGTTKIGAKPLRSQNEIQAHSRAWSSLVFSWGCEQSQPLFYWRKGSERLALRQENP